MTAGFKHQISHCSSFVTDLKWLMKITKPSVFVICRAARGCYHREEMLQSKEELLAPALQVKVKVVAAVAAVASDDTY